MAKNSTVTNVDDGDDAVAAWPDAVKETVEALFADKKVYAQAYASSTTFNINNGSIQSCDLDGDITISLSNQEVGRAIVLILKHDESSRTINWFSTIRWAYNYTPIPSAANKYDVFLIIPISYAAPNWTYLGFVIGQEQ